MACSSSCRALASPVWKTAADGDGSGMEITVRRHGPQRRGSNAAACGCTSDMPITTTPEWQRLALYPLGGITARDLKVVISPALGDIDVLGMNFLSQLASWRVEGRTLILVPPGNTG